MVNYWTATNVFDPNMEPELREIVLVNDVNLDIVSRGACGHDICHCTVTLVM